MFIKKLSVLLGIALSLSAQAKVTEVTALPFAGNKAKISTMEYVASIPEQTSNVGTREAGPASLADQTFISLFNDGDFDMNYEFTVEAAANDSVVLRGLAQGYDVKAKYDATNGTLKIPTGLVIGQYTEETASYDVTLHALLGTSYNDSEITATLANDTLTFDKGIYCTIEIEGTQYYVALMQDITAVKSNASASMNLMNGTTVVMPMNIHLLVTRSAEDQISIIGLSNILYSQRINVPMTFNQTANTATLMSDQPIDFEVTSTGARNIYYMFSLSGQSLVRNPQFNITATENVTAMTAATSLFFGYDTNGQGSYRGFTFGDVKINVDYNIYMAEIVKPALPTEATVDGIIYSLDNDTEMATVTGALGTVTDLDIPASITVGEKTFAVTAVAATAFQANKKITAVHIPVSMKTVGQDAFRNLSACRALYIADLASWCAIEFANGNANPLYNVFSSYTDRNWGDVYVNNTVVTEIEIPEGVTAIGRSFYGFKKLTKVTLPSTLKTLGDQAFGNCVNITSIELPEGLESMGSSFWSCEKLNNVKLPSTVKTVGNNAFYGCKGLTDITLNEGLTTVDMMAFSGCTGLTKIQFPSTLETVGMMALYDCTAITSVTCLAVVPPVAYDNSFEDVVANATLYVPENSVADYKLADGWKTFTKIEKTLPTGVETITSDDNAAAIFFNLQGCKVDSDKLVPGIYVKVVNGKSSKMLVK